ncbi:MAG: LA_0442/LA_0875 N-terminal domain-containing protein [Leptonema sp. (in: bacteria)]
MYKKMFIFFVFVLITSLLYSDTIILKNGQKYEGKIINQTRERVQIRLENGKELVINKNDIQKIQFGPSAEEIKRKQEEERRKLEEQKKQEEERRKLEEQKKQEEERRKLEEQKKQEEERRKLEEQKKQEEERRKLEEQKRKALLQKEPLLKRRELLLYLGRGTSSAYLPLEGLWNLFSKSIGQTICILESPESLFPIINGIGRSTSNISLEMIYNENNWSFGWELIGFNSTPLTKNINYYNFVQGEDYTRSPSQSYLYIEFPGGLKIPDSFYIYTSLYGKYHFYKTKFLYGNIYFSIPIGIMNHDFYLKTESSSFRSKYPFSPYSTQLSSISTQLNIEPRDTNLLYSGIHLENIINDALKWKLQMNVYYGTFEYSINLFVFGLGNPTNFIINPLGIQRGIGLINRFEKSIDNHFFIFVDLAYREIQFSVSTIKRDGYINIGVNTYTPFSLSSLSFLGTFGLVDKDKRFKEINRSLSFGVSYRLGL